MQKLVVFLYINSGKSKNEIKKVIPFMLASKIIKYSKINVTEGVNLYIKSYKNINIIGIN
jgi:hypothetical protein